MVQKTKVPTKLPAHVQRVVDEKRELDTRLAALMSRLGSPGYFALPEAEQRLLRYQSVFMDGYSRVLADRLAPFATAAATTKDQE